MLVVYMAPNTTYVAPRVNEGCLLLAQPRLYPAAMKLGERIRLARQIVGLSQVELARQVGMKQQTLQKIESRPAAKSIFGPAIAQALGLTFEELLAGVSPALHIERPPAPITEARAKTSDLSARVQPALPGGLTDAAERALLINMLAAVLAGLPTSTVRDVLSAARAIAAAYHRQQIADIEAQEAPPGGPNSTAPKD